MRTTIRLDPEVAAAGSGPRPSTRGRRASGCGSMPPMSPTVTHRVPAHHHPPPGHGEPAHPGGRVGLRHRLARRRPSIGADPRAPATATSSAGCWWTGTGAGTSSPTPISPLSPSRKAPASAPSTATSPASPGCTGSAPRTVDTAAGRGCWSPKRSPIGTNRAGFVPFGNPGGQRPEHGTVATQIDRSPVAVGRPGWS